MLPTVEGRDVQIRKGRPLLGVTKKFTVSFTPEQYLAMNDRAVFEGRSMADLIRVAADQYLCRYGIAKL
jgi:hypothetical protein